MTRGALDRGMREDECEAGSGVVRNGECGRSPALNCVAAFASTLVCAGEKLPAVGIGFVAIGARRVRDGRFEIAASMTLEARNMGVFAQQRKLRLCVVEG